MLRAIPAQLADAEVERYSRQPFLPDSGESQQLRRAESSIALSGNGGLEGPAARHLAAAVDVVCEFR